MSKPPKELWVEIFEGVTPGRAFDDKEQAINDSEEGCAIHHYVLAAPEKKPAKRLGPLKFCGNRYCGQLVRTNKYCRLCKRKRQAK
jgi:hypothetical protein